MSMPDKDSLPANPSTPLSLEQGVHRNPENGQVRNDPSLVDGDADELSDGGAKLARHTCDQARP